MVELFKGLMGTLTLGDKIKIVRFVAVLVYFLFD
jgi:hypothetical protein